MAVFDPNDEQNRPKSEMNIAVIMIVLVVIILAIVFVANLLGNKQKKSNDTQSSPSETSGDEQNDDHFISGNKRTSDQLDIWDLDFGNNADSQSASQDEQTAFVTPVAPHSNEILIEYRDGTSKYVPINNKIPKNHYDSSNFVYQKPFMRYYNNGTKISYNGCMISDEIKEIDFSTLARSGLDFVMIRAGYRDVQTGRLIEDKKCSQFIKSALNNDFQVGIYFEGQADDIVFVREEADFVLSLIGDQEITYPVAYYIEPSNDSVDSHDPVGKTLRTDNVLDFFGILSEEGLVPMLGADKETLVMKVDLLGLSSYKIWLVDSNDTPDYPYEYALWTYSDGDLIDGAGNRVRLMIGMEDLTIRTVEKEE